MPRKFSITALIAEADYELGQRRTVYANIKRQHPRRSGQLDEHFALMEAIKETLQWLGNDRAAIEEWILAGKPGKAA